MIIIDRTRCASHLTIGGVPFGTVFTGSIQGHSGVYMQTGQGTVSLGANTVLAFDSSAVVSNYTVVRATLMIEDTATKEISRG